VRAGGDRCRSGEGVGEGVEDRRAAPVHAVRGQVVPPGGATVDDDHGLPVPSRLTNEAKSAHDLQGRAGDQERVRGVDPGDAPGHPVPGHVLAEEHDIRFERAAAVSA
jgi:hypothetical protein